jgi:hypothetical protein
MYSERVYQRFSTMGSQIILNIRNAWNFEHATRYHLRFNYLIQDTVT